MPPPQTNRWVQFLRNYGPIPNNDNMYDEHIQRALNRHGIAPLTLPAQFLDAILENLTSNTPKSEILTGTAGDGKTYHCREVWLRLGGSKEAWDSGEKLHHLKTNGRELVVVKDLSELQYQQSNALLEQMAADVTDPTASRLYLIAANHGQLLERLKTAPASQSLRTLTACIEDLLVEGLNANPAVRLMLRDLSQAPAREMLTAVVDRMTEHEGWASCQTCPSAEGDVCPIRENRKRLIGASDNGLLRKRLSDLVVLNEQNETHFPVRQLLALVANMLLGHPAAPDGLMSCANVPDIIAKGKTDDGSIYRNIFGENLKPRRAEKFELFRKLSFFGIGSETSNKIDKLLVYGADDPDLQEAYRALVLADPVYGATRSFTNAQEAYLEGYDPSAREEFLPLLRVQRQRLFFTLPPNQSDFYRLWDLTVFRYGGDYLDVLEKLLGGSAAPRSKIQLTVRGLNRVFTGMLAQDQDQLVLATSGSHSQSKLSPLLDEMISVHRQGGEEVTLIQRGKGIAIKVQLSRDSDPGSVFLQLTPMRFEFLGRVAEGALPSSFSLECHEDLLAFKAKLLNATERRRSLDTAGDDPTDELVLKFIDLADDGRTTQRRVAVRL
jgi:hypothetical protein